MPQQCSAGLHVEDSSGMHDSVTVNTYPQGLRFSLCGMGIIIIAATLLIHWEVCKIVCIVSGTE